MAKKGIPWYWKNLGDFEGRKIVPNETDLETYGNKDHYGFGRNLHVKDPNGKFVPAIFEHEVRAARASSCGSMRSRSQFDPLQVVAA